MGTTPFPLTDDIVAFRNQVSRAPEIQIGKGPTEIGHERLDIGMTAARLMEGILQQHPWRGDLIDNFEIAGLPPEMSEPGNNDVLVIVLPVVGNVRALEQLFLLFCRHVYILDGFSRTSPTSSMTAPKIVFAAPGRNSDSCLCIEIAECFSWI